jgi:hypothetical protein
MHSTRNGLQNNLIALTLALMVLALWLLTRGYQGFAGDAQLYAFQALARIHPTLSMDLYLQNASQDGYTLFSSFYAWFIGWTGLETAARLLTLFFTVWLIATSWNLAAAITNRGAAWLAIAFLAMAGGDYGAAGVFHISEQFLTARLPAEALIITALAFYIRRNRGLGLSIAIAALFVHPLIALPGVLLLICAWLPVRMSLIGATSGVLAVLIIALISTGLPATAAAFTVMDADWLDVVRERSQFLFLQLWSVRDWDINLRPLLYLAFIAIATENRRMRLICIAGFLVGISGLAVAWVASMIGPVAVLLQGQSWRWIWIACFISILMLPATILRVWRDEKCGPLCAVLLTGGWLVSGLGGTACLLLALLSWLMRRRIGNRAVPYLRLMAAMAGITVLACVSNNSLEPGKMVLAQVRTNLGLKVSAAALFGLLWWWVRVSRTLWVSMIVSAATLMSLLWIVPASFMQARTLVSNSEIAEFSDWSDAIPPTSTVLIAPARDVGSFVWFTLLRPNYLALDQSSGVVFSRATALEIRRRSEMLLPLTDPTWKILSGIRRSASKPKDNSPTRPLTAQALIQVCRDPQLGFVVSPQNVGFDPKRHTKNGPWKDWNLYDCRIVRSNPAT